MKPATLRPIRRTPPPAPSARDILATVATLGFRTTRRVLLWLILSTGAVWAAGRSGYVPPLAWESLLVAAPETAATAGEMPADVAPTPMVARQNCADGIGPASPSRPGEVIRLRYGSALR